MILVIDNYDSFTWNLVHYLMELGAAVDVVRNDALSAAQAISSGASGFLISPGPCTPNEAGISLDLVSACADAKVPLLGVCLGHQGDRSAFWRRRQARRFDARQSLAGDARFQRSLRGPALSVHRHTLSFADRRRHSDNLVVNARSDDGHVMGFRHRTLPIHGVQFHPESIATEHGHDLLANFLDLCGITPRKVAA